MPEQIYNAPPGSPSSVGPQIRTDYHVKEALIEARKEQYFSQLADVTSMPKHFGKTIKKYHYLPILDDQNINDQGIDATGAVIADGNLYGSSKDIGTIPGKMPVLSETGGRVNRVGFKRKEVEGSIEKYGFFDEYTQESLDFDTDAELWSHINREMLNAASEMTEDLLQIDLLNSAGIVRYAGDATADNEVDDADEVDYDDLLRLAITLDNNRTPKHTNIATGTRMVDTATIAAARVLYCGTELIPLIKGMKDLHNEPAFIPVHKYAGGAQTMNIGGKGSGDFGPMVLLGEIGSIDHFRVVIVPEMMKYAGAGADAALNTTHHKTGTNFDVFPMLCVGDGAFTTIGFQTDGKTVKFKITHKPPGEGIADRQDPYGEVGFMSIKWYYGFLLQRPERIAVIKTSAPL